VAAACSFSLNYLTAGCSEGYYDLLNDFLYDLLYSVIYYRDMDGRIRASAPSVFERESQDHQRCLEGLGSVSKTQESNL
jgi:hypothetical protein